jgi:hypothetical protein
VLILTRNCRRQSRRPNKRGGPKPPFLRPTLNRTLAVRGKRQALVGAHHAVQSTTEDSAAHAGDELQPVDCGKMAPRMNTVNYPGKEGGREAKRRAAQSRPSSSSVDITASAFSRAKATGTRSRAELAHPSSASVFSVDGRGCLLGAGAYSLIRMVCI